jgi:hypothetical protein
MATVTVAIFLCSILRLDYSQDEERTLTGTQLPLESSESDVELNIDERHYEYTYTAIFFIT